MVFHRNHHGPLNAVRNVGGSGDEQKISTWHAASHHALLFGYQTAAVSCARPSTPILSVRGLRDQAFRPLGRATATQRAALSDSRSCLSSPSSRSPAPGRRVAPPETRPAT